MTHLRITGVDTVDLADHAPDGAVDVVFVVVRTVAASGWYGPISRTIGARIRDLDPFLTGAVIDSGHGSDPLPVELSASRVDAVTSWALGAIDCAVWDLRGQVTALPVADLLASGGASRVRAYASHLTCQLTDPVAPAVIAEQASAGWAFTKWGLRVAGLPADDCHVRRLAEAVTAAARAARSPVAVDAVGTWDGPLAAAFARRVDHDALIWLEDPLPPGDASYNLLAGTVPVATGEHLLLDDDLSALVAEVMPSALCLDVVGCGGLSRAVRLTARAWQLGIPVYPHGRSLIPAVHLAAAFPDAVPAVEYRLRWEPGRQELLDVPLLPDRGYLSAPQAPGLGATPKRRLPCPTR